MRRNEQAGALIYNNQDNEETPSGFMAKYRFNEKSMIMSFEIL